ncbi:MAG TPA: DoxX family protein, partial [Ignavibacteriaceae bacterium]
LLFLRITIGIFMLTHGTGKLIALFGGGPIQFADPIGIGPAASLALAVFAEFVCSLFLIFGVATRFAVIPLIITMLIAGFIIHAEDLFRVKEMAFLYLSTFITISIAGAGKFSVDNLIYKKINLD